jgi:hypothetical protein
VLFFSLVPLRPPISVCLSLPGNINPWGIKCEILNIYFLIKLSLDSFTTLLAWKEILNLKTLSLKFNVANKLLSTKIQKTCNAT